MAGGLLSCKKDKVPLPSEPTKWEKIAGTYKVYDTLGAFLYEMEIIHHVGIDGQGNNIDSLKFANINGEFDFSKEQSNQIISNMPPNHFNIGNHNPIKDKSGKRWNLQGLTDNVYNCLIGDTIKLRYSKSNIQYYISDLTPYYSAICIEIAIKQH